MSRKAIDFDFINECKDAEKQEKLRVRNEDKAMVSYVRRSEFFRLCTGGMAQFWGLVSLVDDLVRDDPTLLAKARDRGAEKAAGYPRAQEEEEARLEALRVESWSEPAPGLAARLEEDDFKCVSGDGCLPIVFFGQGVLATYRRYVHSPDVVARSGVMTSAVHGRPRSPPAPLATRTASPLRIDKLLKRPEGDKLLIDIVAKHQPVRLDGVVALIKAHVGRSRLEEGTKARISTCLNNLVGRAALTRDADGLLRLKTATGEAVMPAASGHAEARSKEAVNGTEPPTTGSP